MVWVAAKVTAQARFAEFLERDSVARAVEQARKQVTVALAA